MPKRTCPVCGKVYSYDSVTEHKTLPFCSERCRLIDLGAWFAGEHQIVEELRPSDVDEALHEMIDGAEASATESAYDYTEPYHDDTDDSDDDYEARG